MIEKALEFNLSNIPVNGTKFEQVSAIAQQPYAITSAIVIFGTILLLWFLFSFQKVNKKSNRLCFGSWINTKGLLFILLGALLYLFTFVFPLLTYIGG